MKDDKTIIILAAIMAVMVIEAIALLMDKNGAMLMASLTIIGGLAGYQVKKVQEKK